MDGRGEEEEEAAATQLHTPYHPHPLLHGEFYYKTCDLCCLKIYRDDAYFCSTCDFYTHKQCAETPSLIPRHPLHPLHPLSLSNDRPSFTCNVCKDTHKGFSSFGCDECGFFLDIKCALLPLPDPEGSSEEQIKIPIHPHPLISFLDDRRIYSDCKCLLCDGHILKEADAYACLHPRCKFWIHKRCIPDLYYEDGSRVPRVNHRHRLATFLADKWKFIRCQDCESRISSGDCFGCETCEVFYHRDCVKVPETLQHPLHPDHDALVLFTFAHDKGVRCESCSYLVSSNLCYCCTSCEFALHARCGLRILDYCKEGRAVEIMPSWHEHLLFLCSLGDYSSDQCSCCGDVLDGLAYRCKAKDCGIILHKGCTEQLSEINHPHHPEHPLVLLQKFDETRPSCDACCERTFTLSFSCKLCRFYLHVGCASRFPTQKHYLHEHDLTQFEGIPSLECNRCGTSTDSPLLRCVPCDFNLHEKCMELPRVVNHETHKHPLTLTDFFMEDDTGEYYCDLCEQRRDGRLGVYMCLVCKIKMERPWTFHIECILPELRKVNVKKVRDSVLEKYAKEIAEKEEELLVLEKKVEETKQKLEELRKMHTQLSLLKAEGQEEQ